MQTEQHIAITINQSTLQRLIRDKAICLSDLHCLNKTSKRVVHQSFLKSVLGGRRS